MSRETIKYAADGVPASYSGVAPVYGLPKGYVVVDWLLSDFGFKPGEVERRRFINRHHHLITPLLYHPAARAQLDEMLAAHNLREGFADARNRSG